MFRSLVTLSLAIMLAACGGKHGSNGSDAPAAGGGAGGGSPSKTEGFNVSTEVAGAPAAG